MSIITLTTDLGQKDFYLAVLKGIMYSQVPSVNVVDISNHIAPFNIAQAAYVIKNSYGYFPKKTVHLIGVDCGFERHLAMASDEHYFVGPDNGIFSLIFDEVPTKIVEIRFKPEMPTGHFALKEILTRAACHLANGGTLDALGPVTEQVYGRTLLRPVQEVNQLRGNVVYVDAFENAVTNIDRKMFSETGKNRPFQILFKRGEVIENISRSYEDVAEGEKLCLFGISGHLEIAINKGKAAGLLGLGIDEHIRVMFFDKPVY